MFEFSFVPALLYLRMTIIIIYITFFQADFSIFATSSLKNVEKEGKDQNHPQLSGIKF
jgi:hypothetical protein